MNLPWPESVDSESARAIVLRGDGPTLLHL